MSTCCSPFDLLLPQDFVGMISEYIHATVHDEAEAPRVRNLASKAWNALKRSTKAGPRRTVSRIVGWMDDRWLDG